VTGNDNTTQHTMNTLIISIGRNLGYNPSMKLDARNWAQFRSDLLSEIRNNRFQVIASTSGTAYYKMDSTFMEEETYQFVLELPSYQEVGPLLRALQVLAKLYRQEEIAVTYGVYKPVTAS
jgi:hypothetical protein